MEKKAYIYINYPNIVVLRVYLDVIKAALTEVNYTVEYVESLDGISQKNLIVFPMGKDAFSYYHKGYRNIILWQQGATGAESYMRHSSWIRKAVLDYMDCYVMKKAKMVFFVSKCMQEYYELMANRCFSDKAYVMPCFNETLDSSVFEKKDYSKKTFAYVGSTSLWQCFPETVEIYGQIEKQFPDAFLKVLTFNTDHAAEILAQKGIKNYSVSCVPKEQVKRELEDVSYGFIIRHDTEVNRVATPTKISSYLSAGVLPIYSPCLRDFHKQAQNHSFAVAMESGENIASLAEFVEREIDRDIVQAEIEALFADYYSMENHAKKIAALAEKCLNSERE